MEALDIKTCSEWTLGLSDDALPRSEFSTPGC